MNRFEDKRNLRALHVQRNRNSGSPTNREVHGDGASIVLVGVTTYQGAWESQVQGKGKQVLQRVKEGVKARDANDRHRPGTHS